MSGKPTYPTDPESKLADLMRTDLGVTVEPKLLRLFLLHNWDRVSLLSHAIHGTPPKNEGLPPEVERVLNLLSDMEWDRAIQALREYRKKGHRSYYHDGG